MNGLRWLLPGQEIEPSHTMTPWTTAIRTPTGFMRFYTVRECVHCHAEEGISTGTIDAQHYAQLPLVFLCSGTASPRKV